MGKFKVGDVVVRTVCSVGECILGNTYTVGGVDGNYLTLIGIGAGYYSRYFELASQEQDVVNSPTHYAFFPDLEAIQVIARAMTQEQFYGYCLGNRLKYRLRAGKKDALAQDIAKSDKYTELYEQHKHLCHS